MVLAESVGILRCRHCATESVIVPSLSLTHTGIITTSSIV